MSDPVATMIVPFVVPGFSGSNVIVPEMPLALDPSKGSSVQVKQNDLRRSG
jgi:hypothetical protein